jgi:hypothetical protein
LSPRDLTDLSHYRWPFILWGVWAVIVLGVYYLQLWRLVAQGPSVWLSHGRAVADLLVPLGLAAIAITAVWRLGVRIVRRAAAAESGGIALRRLAALSILVAVGLAGLLWLATGTGGILETIPGFPALGEALRRLIGGVAGCLIILLAAQVFGEGVLRAAGWRSDEWAERLLYRTSLGLGTLAYVLLGLAVVGLYTATAVRIVVGVLAAGGFVWLLRRTPGPSSNLPDAQSAPGDRAWKAMALLAVLIAFAAALAPEREYDALWYHLNFPRVWLQRGALVDFPTEYVSLYPMTWELLFGAGLALGGPTAAKLLHFSCLLLVALLVFQSGRRLVPRASPWLAVAIFVTIPTVLWEASTAYIDLALTLHAGLAAYGLLRYAETRARSWCAVAVLNLGLALATKHVAFFVLVLAVVGLALALWHRDRNAKQAIIAGALLAAISLIPPLPWYLRSWSATGNPVFPEFYRVFGAPPDRWDAASDEGLNRYEAQFGRPRTLQNLVTLPWDMTVHAARYGGTLGPLFLLLLPALLIRRDRQPRVPVLVTFVAGYFALWASPLSNFQMRFLIPLTPWLAVLAADGASRLAWPGRGNSDRILQPLTGVLTVLLFLNLPPNTALHETDREGHVGRLTHVIRTVRLGVVSGRQSEDRYLLDEVPAYGAWRFINTRLAADAKILTFSGGDDFYSNRVRLWSDTVAARPATWGSPAGAENQALRALHHLRISHVLLDKKKLASIPGDALAIAQPEFLRRWCAREYEDARVVLYSLRWDKVQRERPATLE